MTTTDMTQTTRRLGAPDMAITPRGQRAAHERRAEVGLRHDQTDWCGLHEPGERHFTVGGR